MDFEKIGRVAKNEATNAAIYEENNVVFAVPYGDDNYKIGLNCEELNSVFEEGIARILGNRALREHGFLIELEHPDLPLFVNPKSIKVEPHGFGLHDLQMDVSITTQSTLNEHRGVLICEKKYLVSSDWQFKAYQTMPPLKEMPEVRR